MPNSKFESKNQVPSLQNRIFGIQCSLVFSNELLMHPEYRKISDSEKHLVSLDAKLFILRVRNEAKKHTVSISAKESEADSVPPPPDYDEKGIPHVIEEGDFIVRIPVNETDSDSEAGIVDLEIYDETPAS